MRPLVRLMAVVATALAIGRAAGRSAGLARLAEPLRSAGSPAQPPGLPGRWHTGTPLPVSIAEVAAGVVEGIVYTGGGFTQGGVSTWFGAYNPEADAWTARAAMPEAVHHPGMAGAGGRVWLAGGYTAQQLSNQSTHLYAYDPTSDTWERRADMPGRRAAHFLVPLAGRLYVVGGTGDATDTMYVYDIATDGWTEAPGPTQREHLGAAASGGKVYVVAGRGFGHGNVGWLEAYDPATQGWERLPDMPGVCGGCSAAATGDGAIHVTGGEDAGGTHGEHYVFEPASKAWYRATDLPTPRHGIATAGIGDRFYVIAGGVDPGLSYTDIVEWWEPGLPITATATATAEAPASATPPGPTTTPDALPWAIWLPKAERGS